MTKAFDIKNEKTYQLAVIGSPIGHSLSPLIHTTLLDYLGLKYTYEKAEVNEGELAGFIERAKESCLCGFNVTMPHKRVIIPYLDEISEDAQRFNSVNTVKISKGRLIGFNTDADGFCMSLPSSGEELKDARVVIIGAGGASSSLALKAAYSDAASVTVLNRSVEKASEICRAVTDSTGISSRPLSLSSENLNTECADADIIINATPLGMAGTKHNFESLEFLEYTKKSTVVCDLIYNPSETELLKKARTLGLKYINGLGMLIFQGLIADKIFLDTDFDAHTVAKLIKEKYEKAI